VLEKIRSFFTRTNDYESTTSSILSSCMTHISRRLVMHLSGGHYRWKENEGTRVFECLILSKFLIDYALFTTFTRCISESRRQSYLNMTDTIFESILKSTFPLLSLSDFVRNKLEVYTDMMSNSLDPTCWQRLAGACTGIDYYSEKDLPALSASSLVLPALLQVAQDSWEEVIKG
jgi:hypothetical protein